MAVDDDELVLLNTVAMLEDLGHTVLQADGGAAALDLMRRRGGVDLLVTDQAMPKMTGAVLADAVRSQWPGLPIILASGYADLPPGVAIEFHRLAKPFSQDDLAEAINEVVERQA
jgi:CheY-like chemotaxis protein